MLTNDSALLIGVISLDHTHAYSYVRALRSRGHAVVITDPGGEGADDRGATATATLDAGYADDVADLLALEPDAVIVTSVNAHHRRHIEQAVAAGVPVLSEKPLASTLEDARDAAAAAKAAGVPLCTAFPVRFAPSFVRMLHRVRRGDIGEIVAIHGTNTGRLPSDRAWFTDPQLAGGGALVDHVVHCADMIDLLLEEESASAVFASANTIRYADRAQAETSGLVSIVYPSGRIASIDCSWSEADAAVPGGGLTLEVHGTRGTLRVDPFASHVSGFDADGPIWEGFGADLDALMIDAFLAEIGHGTVDADMSVADAGSGVRTLAIVDAALRSVRSGREEECRPPV